MDLNPTIREGGLNYFNNETIIPLEINDSFNLTKLMKTNLSLCYPNFLRSYTNYSTMVEAQVKGS